MKRQTLKLRLLSAAVTIALLGGAVNAFNLYSGETVAQAQSVSAIQMVRDAKAQGLIGETIAGYLDVVNGQSINAATRAAMSDINIRRRDEEYRPIAKRDGLTLEQVARAFGEKLIAKTPKGQFVLGEDGQWRRK
jgi:uncharacterized protein YdbL (DUF1318 family)